MREGRCIPLDKPAEPSTNKSTLDQPVCEHSARFVDRSALLRLNDASYIDSYGVAIVHALKTAQEDVDSKASSVGSSDLHSSMANMELGPGDDESGNESMGIGQGVELSNTEAALPGMELESDQKSESEEEFAEVTVLDVCHDLSIFGLMAANLGILVSLKLNAS